MTLSFWLLKVTLILSLALVLDFLLRRRAVLACAAMWNAALLALALLPAAVLLAPATRLPLLRAETPPVPLASPGFAASFQPPTADRPWPTPVVDAPAPPIAFRLDAESVATANRVEPPPAGVGRRFAFTWPLVFALLYGLGVCLGLVRLMMGLATIRTLIATSSPLGAAHWRAAVERWTERLGCEGVQLRQSSHVEAPIMAGLLRPAILLPQRMVVELSPESGEAVIVHELAHVLRGDFGWHLLLRLVQAGLWFHPLIWLAERRIHFIRERACDEFAVHVLGSCEQYAETLLAIAGQINRRPSLRLGQAVVRTPHIATRLEALVGSRGIASCQLSGLGRILIWLGCLTLSAFVGSIEIVQAPQPPAAQATKQTQQQDPPPPAATNSAVDQPADERAAPNSANTISGEVTLANNGGPVVGATVFLRDGGLHRATTDEQGRFHFADKPLDNYELWALKETLVADKQRITAEQPAADGVRKFAPVRLRMSPGKEIHVRVTANATGQPVESAQVALEYPYRQHQATDKDGQAVLQGLLAQPHRLTIEAAGHARVLREIDLRSAEQITTLTESFAPGGTVRGVVTDDKGQPLAKANVVYLTPDSPVGFYGDSPYSDANGAFRSLHLPLNAHIRLMVS